MPFLQNATPTAVGVGQGKSVTYDPVADYPTDSDAVDVWVSEGCCGRPAGMSEEQSVSCQKVDEDSVKR